MLTSREATERQSVFLRIAEAWRLDASRTKDERRVDTRVFVNTRFRRHTPARPARRNLIVAATTDSRGKTFAKLRE